MENAGELAAKELALTAWNVLISIIWINDTLREQER